MIIVDLNVSHENTAVVLKIWSAAVTRLVREMFLMIYVDLKNRSKSNGRGFSIKILLLRIITVLITDMFFLPQLAV